MVDWIHLVMSTSYICLSSDVIDIIVIFDTVIHERYMFIVYEGKDQFMD